MRVLIVGANGLLGSNVVHAGLHREWNLCGTYHSTEPAFDIPLTQFDLRDYASFNEVLRNYDPDVVINCAAMTDVDGCERNPEQAQLLNGDAPGELAAQCATTGVNFVHVSTDYVFDGTNRQPYTESAKTNPQQVYGESKLSGEYMVTDALPDALIVRLSFVWGIHRGSDTLSGFPAWVRDQLHSDELVPLFTDQSVTPTRAGQAAETLLDLIQRDTTGYVHIACLSCVTPYEFGSVIADEIGHSDDLLIESSMDDVDRVAVRPTHSCLNVERVESMLDRPQPTIRDDVDAVGDAFR